MDVDRDSGGRGPVTNSGFLDPSARDSTPLVDVTGGSLDRVSSGLLAGSLYVLWTTRTNRRTASGSSRSDGGR